MCQCGAILNYQNAFPTDSVRIIHKQWRRTFDLDGIRKEYGTPEKVIGILRHNATQTLESKWIESDKADDVIQYPIPITYQAIVDQ